MTDYKLVPIPPTPEMVEAAEDAYMPFGDMDLALRMALLAAPDVQGEPVAYAAFSSNGNILWCADPFQVETLRQEYGEALQPLYAAPQPAEQQPMPDVSGMVEALEWLRGAINATPENDKHQSGTWISTKHPRIKQIDELLAAHRKGGEA